jgi:hypothetical protein
MRDCLRLVPSVSWKCESWLSAPAGKISGIESLRLDARRFGWIRHPEHSRRIPLRYLKDSIMGSLARPGLAVSLGTPSFPNENYRIN